ncbi:hypothetical protein QBC35DRAFT_494998 [Podospora australis]|uniref:Uncharacterized protein n=1 Tax=Podospora australis TaxID=1536484 RepID=A0AAN6WWC9_9PEZI|nr:hypothetical protein QBC35DRAFT_494998 [Podospora australis]
MVPPPPPLGPSTLPHTPIPLLVDRSPYHYQPNSSKRNLPLRPVLRRTSHDRRVGLRTSTMTSSSFRKFGLAMLPYLAWNVWFGVGPARGMLTRWMALDFVGNVFFCLGSSWCSKVLRGVEEEEDKKNKVE